MREKYRVRILILNYCHHHPGLIAFYKPNKIKSPTLVSKRFSAMARALRFEYNNPTLMRLRELDVLEKVAGNSKLNVVLGEKGLADRVVNLL